MLSPYLLLGAALATSGFPADVADDLDMPCTPSCALCHEGSPSSSTAVSPFVLALKDRGLRANDSDSLLNALDQLDASGVDSDGDGVSDIDELMDGTDPNADGGALCELDTPRYGCTTASAPARTVLLLLPLLLWWRRERRQTNADAT